MEKISHYHAKLEGRSNVVEEVRCEKNDSPNSRVNVADATTYVGKHHDGACNTENKPLGAYQTSTFKQESREINDPLAREKFRGILSILIQHLGNLSSIISELYSSFALTLEQKEEVDCCKTNTEKIFCLVDCLGVHNLGAESLGSALSSAGNEHIKKILEASIETANSKSTEKWANLDTVSIQRELLTEDSKSQLMKNMQVRIGLLAELYDRNVLNFGEVKQVNACTTESRKVESLLHLLESKNLGIKALKSLLDESEFSSQKYLVSYISTID